MPSDNLQKIDAARTDAMIAGLGGRPAGHHGRWADPGMREIRSLSNEDLAEIIAREPQTKLGRLADSVQRSRESWRTPAKWALIVALCSLIVALYALYRTP
jgi:hypothetical protein